ncbi:30S ribosomal protein S6 [bacterium]|nr:30S ribosomal protein S6 [bacterium]
MRYYETAFLVAPNLPEEDREKFINQMSQWVSQNKGKMIKVEKWGKKKMAYPIKKFNEAFYVFFLYEGEPDIPVELERRFKHSESVIRYLTVKKEPTEVEEEKKKSKEESPKGEKGTTEASPGSKEGT